MPLRASATTLTVGSAAAISGTLQLRGATAGHIVMPDTLTGTLVGFVTSPDGVTYRSLYGASGAAVYVASSAAGSRAYPLPSELFGAHSFAIQTGTVQAAARNFIVRLEGE